MTVTDSLSGWTVQSGGDARRTMMQMARNVRASLLDPAVVEPARAIVHGVAPRDCVAQAREIRRWVDKRFRFVRDPLGVELLETPAFHLARIRDYGFVQGDCDDAATITAALGMAIGIPASLHAVAFAPGAGFSHVFTMLHPPGAAPVEMDVTHVAGTPKPPIFRSISLTV
jgi:transglutaminase-like putative cysteine protease